MKVLFCEFVTIFFMVAISVCQSSGVFYKVDNLKLTDSSEQIIQEDTINCAREGSCQNFSRALQPNVNQPGDENAKLSLYFEKISPGTGRIYKSCTEVLHWNRKIDTLYRVRHPQMTDFGFAECKVVQNKTIAILHHDAEMTIAVHGYEEPGSFRKPITYTNSLDIVKSFVDTSVSCRQFVRIDCKYMKLRDANSQYGYLIDRDYKIMMYFGDGPRNGTGCKCGITNSCAYSGELCNCEANDSTWRFDEGYITDKQRLPLREVRLGDTGLDIEHGKLTLGPIECTEP